MLALLILFAVITPPLAILAGRVYRTRTLAPVAEAARGVAAGAVAGVVWGIGARAAMRAVALADGEPAEFTVGGTLFILIVGAVLGALLGLVFASVRCWLPDTGLGKGGAFGGTLLALMLVLLALVGEVDAGRSGLVGVALFGALFIVYGLVLEATMQQLRRPHRDPGAAARGGAERPQRTPPAAEPVL